MRESTRWTTKYQFVNMLLTNLKATAIAFVFFAGAFYGFIDKPGIKEILSIVFITMYFGIVYSRAHKFALLDTKDYTVTKPSLLKGFLFGVAISLTYAVFLIIYALMWKYAGVDGTINSVPAWIYSIVFWFYTIPYGGIMGLAHGQMMWYSEVLMLLIPILATTLGYLAGLKGFKLMDKMAGAIYEKNEN